MKLTIKNLRKLACELEGGLVQVDAVEGIEYLRWVRALLAAFPESEVNEWLLKTPARDVSRVECHMADR